MLFYIISWCLLRPWPGLLNKKLVFPFFKNIFFAFYFVTYCLVISRKKEQEIWKKHQMKKNKFFQAIHLLFYWQSAENSPTRLLYLRKELKTFLFGKQSSLLSILNQNANAIFDAKTIYCILKKKTFVRPLR